MNVNFITITDPLTEVAVEYAIIDRGNGEFTSMLKSTWDELEAQKEQSGTL